MRLLHDLAKTRALFDDPNLVSRAGLVPVMGLAARCGLADLADEHVRVGRRAGVNADLKVSCLVAGMAAGADCIDDLDVLRHGAMGWLFGGDQSGAHHDSWDDLLDVYRAFRSGPGPHEPRQMLRLYD